MHKLENAKQLSNEHWTYIEKLLRTHNTPDRDIRLVEFHYKTAFIHGYKHALEELKQNSGGI